MKKVETPHRYGLTSRCVATREGDGFVCRKAHRIYVPTEATK